MRTKLRQQIFWGLDYIAADHRLGAEHTYTGPGGHTLARSTNYVITWTDKNREPLYINTAAHATCLHHLHLHLLLLLQQTAGIMKL